MEIGGNMGKVVVDEKLLTVGKLTTVESRVVIDVHIHNFHHAKLAVELFESEYLGQSQKELWAWAVKEAENRLFSELT